MGFVGAMNAVMLGSKVYSLITFDVYQRSFYGQMLNDEGLEPTPIEAAGEWGVYAEALSLGD